MRGIGLVALAIATLGLAPSALGDGLPSRSTVASSAQSFNWSGLYIGGHVGGASANTDWSVLTTATGAVEPIKHDSSTVFGGGHLGLQHQWGAMVVGIEGSMSGGPNFRDAVTSTVQANRSRDARISSLFALTGRIGYAMDRTLVYAKAGWARAELQTSSFVTDAGTQTSLSRDTSQGWTVGAGVEYGFTPNIILGLEYNYYALDGTNRCITSATTSINGCSTGAGVVNVHQVGNTDIHAVTARLSFLLGRDAARAPLK